MRKAVAELRKYNKYEEDIWKQKANMHWFKKGDRNIKFFHAHVNEKRKKLQIQSIEDNQGGELTTDQEIGAKAIKIFQNQFMETNL